MEATYHFTDWLLFFYIYCMLGWCFETTYVSICKKKFVNRGFMKGPFLPIYGAGAVTVLFVTIPFRKNIILIYIFGALAATILEYITGELMERLFKVRYWDYSRKKFNYKGHICLSSTVAWGFLSILMTQIIHKPIENIVFKISSEFRINITIIITVVAVFDFTMAFKTALNIKELLEKSETIKSEMELLQKRVEVVEAVILDEIQQHKENSIQKREDFSVNILERIENLMKLSSDKLEQFKNELQDMRTKVSVNKFIKERLQERFDSQEADMLKRNPTAYSQKYKDALEHFKKFSNKK